MSIAAPPVTSQPVRTARQFFERLAAPDSVTRLSTLRAVQAQPRAALAFGLFEGRDVIDVLLLRSREYEDLPEWMDWVATLSVFRDPRVTEFFVQVIGSFKDPTAVFAAMRYLAGEPSVVPVTRLLAHLLQNECPVRARAVAQLLEPLLLDVSINLQPRAALRIALLSDGRDPPPLNNSTADAWLAELRGPFRPEAVSELEQQGEPAWTMLADCWSELDDRDRLWILEWGSAECLAGQP
jgi:hypothetical protein